MNNEDRVEFHGNDIIRGLSAFETMISLIDFLHKIRTSLIEITGAKDVRPALMVDDETVQGMLDLNVFVHYHEEQPYANRYWAWLEVEPKDLLDQEGFLKAIVERITNEYKLHTKDDASTRSGDQ